MKNTPAIPDSYAAWRHCITVECGIPLTEEFIRKRLAILGNPDEHETRRFAAAYGAEHLRAVLSWFERAAREIDGRSDDTP
ncbi:hypothetical protein AvCA_29170 [Azotobacter vinelandii CA]|uniref:Uncharacterized protein n=2 Tax=Azotobacter vinelandii TaxID=354 RepID=C1DLZ9_AZOVD|nr:hypothetical protein [Azotobacter vinelandii]ACO79086.1 conserved hypothetical protein [Azotobacter vinelandii DJ]AGK14818.1 hypothetical protein AvCA_29170 [Azotobacter vinelandii CA]AGK20955.1 hypothetical protein AvCA6_29170 [Azotobacter vinelandii CA6]WKN20065.1 hypothetical protein AVAEIV_003000 [Azotobacter vinelandii]SFX51226.1 hypothetical protein SAMN04244547_01808 [Azotobacter vinelandii]